MPGFRSPQLQRARVPAWLVLGAFWLGACQSPPQPGPNVGSNSNWLHSCAVDAECSDIPCRCGVCTPECTNDTQCQRLGAAAHCALGSELPVQTSCDAPALAQSGVCLPRCEPGACGDAFACIDGTCVPQPLPAAAFCEPFSSWEKSQRTREEQLLGLLEQRRGKSGGLNCGQQTTAAAPPLRLDPRLTCAARALALDMSQTKNLSLVDAQGRNTNQRMQLAGYSHRLWGESFAVSGVTVENALELMLNDLDSCMRFADARYRDVGVGSAGDVMIVTIGAP